ncbi:tyrosine--tRNA ligase [Candidatus Woesearchaeota archaeon]|jgi:tyrosyl-tRNA synthetase|nr:tyrosine--tRNA ligase [Candidatus Woesearchaeota archaeon]MBT4114436.1 tyrosine--tRNA ligase [Candidatus Woesearchaeota archaeon]MBT4248244.1 tyrosine--tRNA ligase [Candidatus Woesearchaeota archaeon]
MDKFSLIARAPVEEIFKPEDLKKLLASKIQLKHYIGFEISGLIHLGTGLMAGAVIADLQKAGVQCSIFLADWHSWINNKLGGDMATIQRVAVGYFKEGMKISAKIMGADTSKIKFVLGSQLYHNNDLYWQTMIDVAKHMSVGRAKRSITIMGRKEGEDHDLAKYFYPPMQVADIFAQGLHIAHAGMDQRKAHVVARDVALKISTNPLIVKGKQIKPVTIQHHLVLGLQKPPMWPVPKDKLQEIWSTMKMSKSIPDSAVFIHDSEADIRRKMEKAFCPAGEVGFNPVLDWTKHIVFRCRPKLVIKRPEKFGGNITFNSYSDLTRAYGQNKIHPMDLKNAVAEALVEILKPARDHFAKPKYNKMLTELQRLRVTR